MACDASGDCYRMVLYFQTARARCKWLVLWFCNIARVKRLVTSRDAARILSVLSAARRTLLKISLTFGEISFSCCEILKLSAFKTSLFYRYGGPDSMRVLAVLELFRSVIV